MMLGVVCVVPRSWVFTRHARLPRKHAEPIQTINRRHALKLVSMAMNKQLPSYGLLHCNCFRGWLGMCTPRPTPKVLLWLVPSLSTCRSLALAAYLMAPVACSVLPRRWKK